MVVSTAVALEESIRTLPSRYERAVLFRSILEDGIAKKNVEILGANASRIPHTTFVRVGNRMASYIMTQLEAEGIYVGLGSACGALHTNSNPIATALGYAGSAEDYVRISQYGDYGEREARQVVFALSKYL
jgi:cysteine sulfinate desulfinase/cysteine desulfurase-like protein